MYLIGATNSRESDAVGHSKNECYIKDLGDVRRSRHNSSFPAPAGYKMPQLVHSSSKASHSIVGPKPLQLRSSIEQQASKSGKKSE